MDTTSVSLLERVRNPADQEAWNRFVQLYSPLLFDWCRRSGLQLADAADLTQDVFATLFQKLPDFTYDRHKSFRAWLRTVTLNHWRDRQRRIGTRPLPGAGQPLDSLKSPDQISALEEHEYQQNLLSRALQVMRADFEPATWQAFWAHAVEGQPAAVVAAKLGLTLTAVYGAKFRVLNRLRQELQGLLD
jgi:RNA polymerase sigma-70 factor (ECF subfamily)